jgi:hypothetical protein
MKNEHEERVPAASEATPIELSTLVLGEVTELTKDLNFFDCRFDVWVWGQWYPPPPPEG